MSKKNKVALSDLMKKQISEKSSKKALNQLHSSVESAKVKKPTVIESDDEKTAEELLQEAKNESRAKVAEYNNFEMVKKMIIENIVKYTTMIFLVAISAIGIVKFGSAFLAFLNGLLYRMIMSAFGQ